MKKILALILTVIFFSMASITAFAVDVKVRQAEPKENLCQYEDALDYKYLDGYSAFSILPSKYDPREETNLVQQWGVQSQTDGSCWAFAATAAYEAWDNMKNSSVFENNQPFKMFSQYHLASGIYKNEADDLGWTYNQSEGGNRGMASAYYMRGSGPVKLTEFDANSYGLYKTSKNYYDIISLKQNKQVTAIMYITDINSSYTNQLGLKGYYPIENSYSTTRHSNIKRAIREYGAVMSVYHAPDINAGEHEEDYYNFDAAAYCYAPRDIESGPNHAITIVGWDDNYSSENFVNIEDVPQELIPDDVESRNGAWIVRNSWGNEFGENGYFYVSYFDYFIGAFATVFSGEAEPCDYISQHDGVEANSSICLADGGNNPISSLCAISRHNTQDEDNQYLVAVGCSVVSGGTRVSLSINDNITTDYIETPMNFNDTVSLKLKNQNIENIEIYNNSATFMYPGHYVLELEQPILVSNTFDIYLNYEDIYEEIAIIPEVVNNLNSYTKAVVKEGVSWITNADYNFWGVVDNAHIPIKAYMADKAPELSEEDLKDNQLTVTISIYNTAKYNGKSLIIAVYDDGLLKGINQKNISASYDKEEISVPCEDGNEYRVFIWDGQSPLWATDRVEIIL